MRATASSGGICGTARRLYRAWRARLRRDRAPFTLLALLTLSFFGEPLLCIAHCDLWLPFAYARYFAAPQPLHHHHHTPGMNMGLIDAAPQAPAGGSAIERGLPLATPGCLMRGASGGEVPFHVPPSPVHDMLPVLAALLIVLAALGIALPAPPADPPPIFIRPPLRPPIPLAV